MNKKYIFVSNILQESASYSDSNFAALKQEPAKIANHIRILQGRVKSHSGAELSGSEAVSALKRIKEKFPREWETVMKQQENVDKSWMKEVE